MDARRKHEWGVFAGYLAGVLMIASGTTGSTALIRIGYTLLAAWFPTLDWLLFTGLLALLVLASLGGFTVLWGTYLVDHGRRKRGKLLITLGVGAGIVGLVFHIILVWFEGRNIVVELVGIGSTASGLAVLLSVYARAMV